MPKTVEEIAKETGFSLTTVRFVISGQADKYRISEKTRQRIEDYVRIHGYSINHAARSLKLNRSETIGFVVPDLSNAFFARLMAALEILCRQENLLLLTVASHEEAQLENRAILNLLARGVDGLVIAPCQADLPAQLSKSRIRQAVVLFDRDYGSPIFPSIVSDNEQSSLAMTRKMLTESRAPVHFLCAHTALPSIAERMRGFLAACAEVNIAHGAALIEQESNAQEDSAAAGARLMRAIIDRLHAPPQAFMCSSLLVLEGALQEIKRHAGRIPSDILIGTFDDHAMLDLLPNRIWSTRQDEVSLAQQIFAQLNAALGGQSERHSKLLKHVVPSALVLRNL